MAEIAGLAIGGVGLAALFTTCIEFMDLVTLEREHGKTLEVSLAQLSLLNCRFNVWGEIMRVQNEGRELPALRERWPEIGEVVGKTLVSIQDAFTDASALEKRYGLKKVVGSAATTLHESSEMKGILDAFHISQRRRQSETSIVKRTWWAIHDKKKFDTLLVTVNVNIDNLEKLGEGLNILEKQKKKILSSIDDIDDTGSIELLQEAEQAIDELAASSSDGHLFLRTAIGQKARVTMGNVDSSDGSRHNYRDTKVYGEANVHMGNLSGASAATFWGAPHVP